MKKIFIIILVLIVLLILGVVVFVMTFDADKYRPQLVQKIEEATGKKASLAHIALVWKNGIALELKDLKIFSAQEDSKTIAQIESATALIRTEPLLRKSVEVATVTLVRPLLDIERKKDGSLSLGGAQLPKSLDNKAGAFSQASSAVVLSIDSVRITGGEVLYHDHTSATPIDLAVKQLDMTIRNFSLSQPISFESQAAVLGEAQNISIRGTIKLPQKDQTGSLDAFTAKLDLGLLNMSEAAKAFPALRSIGISEKLSGQLEIVVATTGLDPKAIQSTKADVTLKGGSITLAPSGEASALKSKLTINDLDVFLKGLSLTEFFSFDVQGSVLATKRNISAQGQLQLPQKDKAGLIRESSLKTDLGSLDLKQLLMIFPDLKSAGLKDKLSGDLDIKVDELSLDPASLQNSKAELHLKNADLLFQQLPQPVQRLNINAFYENDSLTLKDTSCYFAGGQIKLSASIDQPMGQAGADFRLSAKELAVKELAPVAQGKTGLTGNLSLDFEGKSSGKQWPEISRSLMGQGRLTLTEGLLLNYNILRIVVEKIANIPIIGQTLLERFPAQYRQDLDTPNTVLKPAEIPFLVSDGKVNVPNLAVGTGLFDVYGSAQFGFDKSVNGNLLLQMNSMLSQALVKEASQVQLLANAQGQLEIPLKAQGILPNATVLPDVEYLTNKIMASKAQEVVTNLIKDPNQDLGKQLKGLFGDSPTQTPEAGAAPAPAPKAEPAPESNPWEALLRQTE